MSSVDLLIPSNSSRVPSSASFTSEDTNSNRSGNSPIESKSGIWPAAGNHMITLSPPAGDRPSLLSASEPTQSSSNGRTSASGGEGSESGSWTDSSAMDQMPSGSGVLGSDEVEGVWSADIEQAFQEAMLLYPPCGRRKIILSDEGKMYGRNELIARYIKIRCGKTRTRKQVSSHIQVLNRKRDREHKHVGGTTPKDTKPSPPSLQQIQRDLQSVAASVAAVSNSSSAPTTVVPTPIVPPQVQIKEEQPQLQQTHAFNQLTQQIGKSQSLLAAAGIYPSLWPQPFSSAAAAAAAAAGGMHDLKAYQRLNGGYENLSPFNLTASSPLKEAVAASMMGAALLPQVKQDSYQIASSRLSLCGFTAFADLPSGRRVDMVQIPDVSERKFDEIIISNIADKYPRSLVEMFDEGHEDAFFLVKCWANIDFGQSNVKQTFFGVDSVYQSSEDFEIEVSTKVCTFGKIAVEKTESAKAKKLPNGKYVFDMENSPFCDYMVCFITHLKLLDKKEEQDAVLENFSALQVVRNTSTKEVLLVIAFMFAVSDQPDSGCSIFRLIP